MSPFVNFTTKPWASPAYAVVPGGRPGASKRSAGMLLGCVACTPVIRTEADAPPRLTVRLPPTPIAAVHGDDVGTVVSSSRPAVTHTGVGAPRTAWILSARNVVASVAVISTAFLRAAMVARFEFELA